MPITTGKAVSGQVVLDAPGLVDGTVAYVVARNGGEACPLTDDELTELRAGIAEADRGETISGDQLFERLCRYG